MAKTKRKEYMEEAERAILSMFVSYSKDHNEIPDGIDSLFKSALTRARSKVHSSLIKEAAKRLGYNGIDYYKARSHPDFQYVLSNVIKEAEQDVDNFWVRFINT